MLIAGETTTEGREQDQEGKAMKLAHLALLERLRSPGKAKARWPNCSRRSRTTRIKHHTARACATRVTIGLRIEGSSETMRSTICRATIQSRRRMKGRYSWITTASSGEMAKDCRTDKAFWAFQQERAHHTKNHQVPKWWAIQTLQTRSLAISRRS